MIIAIAYNAVRENSTPDERDVLAQVTVVSHALEQLGHTPVPLPVDIDLSSFQRDISRIAPGLVFNLVESLGGSGRLISVVPALLSGMGIACTGSPAESIHLTSHKVLAKHRMRMGGLATPPWIGPLPHEFCSTYSFCPGAGELSGTWIVKSLWEHASIGICDEGILQAQRLEEILVALRQSASRLGGACFAERFIDGREFNLSILARPHGPMVLPPAEISFEEYAPEKPRIVCYRAKWEEASFEYAHTPRHFDFPASDTPLLSALADVAKQCWNLFDLRGYARIDFRVDGSGRPWILEVNANPCLSPDAGFTAAIERAGMTFTDAVSDIIADALASKDPDRVAASSVKIAPSSPAATPVFRYEPRPSDVAAIRELVSATRYFHPYEVDVAVELVEDRLAKGNASEYFFVFYDTDDRLSGYACYGPIACTQNSYDIYWIAVQPDRQRRGIGRIILDETERLIRKAGGYRIYIDTSESETYHSTRAFYLQCGYHIESILKDFYSPGDGKMIFCKCL